MSEFKDALGAAMRKMAEDPKVVFIGYGVRIGGKGAGTFDKIPDAQLIETPVAENLMVSLAIGLSLQGFKPVVFFERFDFVPHALDAIVNHLDKIEVMSKGQFKPTAIIRVVVGNTQKPLFTCRTHTQDFTEAMKLMCTFPVIKIPDTASVPGLYAEALRNLGRHSTMLVEMKENW